MGRAERAAQRPLVERGEVADGARRPAARGARASTGPTPHSRGHRQRVEELQLVAGNDLDDAPPRHAPAPASPAAWPRRTPAWPGTCSGRRRPSTSGRARRRRRPGSVRRSTCRRRTAASLPVTSRNASSSDERLDERRVRRAKISCTSRADRRRRARGRRAGTRRAGTAAGPMADGIAECTPYRRASYDAAATTPRRPVPPTTTGRPRARAGGAARPTRRTRPCRRAGSTRPRPHRSCHDRHTARRRRRCRRPRRVASAATVAPTSTNGLADDPAATSSTRRRRARGT